MEHKPLNNKIFLILTLFSFGIINNSCKTFLRAAPPPAQNTLQAASPNVREVALQDDVVEEVEEIELDLELPPPGSNLPVSVFKEVWAYVVADNEDALVRGLPITDVGYFGAGLNSYGELINVPDRRKLRNFSGRVHLVVADNGRALTYFALKPGSPERQALISGLLEATKNFDGLQIDFEYVPARSRDSFVSFMEELKEGLPRNKMFTVALPARVRTVPDDVYDYARITALVDRVLIMAYDEHWSTSDPGPVASLGWGRRVAEHYMRTIGSEKLIMGIPFYGRAWGRPNHSRAYYYSGVQRIMRENNVAEARRDNGIPHFEYRANITVRVYYDDEYSLSTRMEIYRNMGVTAVGFWRLGQETPVVWPLIKIGTN
jgi:spore germination protein YaaH